ncbi:MAG TPA: DNA-processing protein DprA [Rhodanobacteraceae bacterium]|nr:DNA-processing protein DprA [Rhodanobacteraceae bacterium]
MAEADDTRAWLILLRVPGLGPARLRALLAEAGGEARAALRRVGHRQAMPDAARIEADLAWLATPGHRLLLYTDPDFPPQLEVIPQPPVALFVAGDAGLLLRPQVAIVGARNASAGGRANARAFATALAATGLLVTSGLAEGIDGVAHAAALDAGAPTLAVMGTGPDVVYPRAHKALAARIAEHGALVSEFPPGVTALPEHFPRRNRLIAGLALGTLVIEAGMRSGSLITARLAAEQGREVFALPGSIHNPLARGCHRLIRDGVRLVETVDEVVEALRPLAQALGAGLQARLAEPAAGPAAASGWQDDPAYRRLLKALGHDPTALDELAVRTELGPAALSSMLLMLELDGAVAGLPGGRYQRLA